MIEINDIDVKNYGLIRNNVSSFIEHIASTEDIIGNKILDVAPEIHAGAAVHFLNATVQTLDINYQSNADYILDLCNCSSTVIPNNTFNVIICTEVLEHVHNPFLVVQELYRMATPGGKVCITTPFNFRIHGPLPDNWRFTIHGLRVLFENFNIIDIQELQTDNRNLMPVHYTLIAEKPNDPKF